jgi:regulator of replication initiation timing
MTTLPAPDAPNTDSRALNAQQVGAKLIQNAAGGLGAGVVVATLMWLANVPLSEAWRWPVGVAIITAGAATAWRAWIDEYRAGRNWQRREDQHAEEMRALILDLDDVEAEVEALAADNAALRSRNQWLEQRLNQPLRINGVPQEPSADPAHKDAITLINKRYGQGVPVTARHMMSVGWSDDRYKAALGILKASGIVEVRGTQTSWAMHSPESASLALSEFTPVVLSTPTSETRE